MTDPDRPDGGAAIGTRRATDRDAALTALAEAARVLACPVCGEAVALENSSVVCAGGHRFDVAKQGYVSLLRGGGNATTGDGADMVAARDALLARGHYAPIADAVAGAIGGALPGVEASTSPRMVVDLAGGTGYYLEHVLLAHPELRGIVVDLSKFAARRAARRHPALAAVVADVWQPLPLRTDAAAAVLSIFGPRNRPEILRILAPGAPLIVVTPTARHLHELVKPLGMIGVDERKQERLAAQLDGFTDLASRDVEYTASLSHEDVINDVLMGPSAHHVDASQLAERVALLPEPVGVTVSVTVTTCRAPRIP